MPHDIVTIPGTAESFCVHCGADRQFADDPCEGVVR